MWPAYVFFVLVTLMWVVAFGMAGILYAFLDKKEEAWNLAGVGVAFLLVSFVSALLCCIGTDDKSSSGAEEAEDDE